MSIKLNVAEAVEIGNLCEGLTEKLAAEHGWARARTLLQLCADKAHLYACREEVATDPMVEIVYQMRDKMIEAGMLPYDTMWPGSLAERLNTTENEVEIDDFREASAAEITRYADPLGTAVARELTAAFGPTCELAIVGAFVSELTHMIALGGLAEETLEVRCEGAKGVSELRTQVTQAVRDNIIAARPELAPAAWGH